jgi:hypothetical protein
MNLNPEQRRAPDPDPQRMAKGTHTEPKEEQDSQKPARAFFRR